MSILIYIVLMIIAFILVNIYIVAKDILFLLKKPEKEI